MEETIRRQARAALIAGIVGVCFLGFVFGIGAIVRAHVARSLIARHGVGQAHLKRANLAMALGIGGLTIWTVAAVFLLV